MDSCHLCGKERKNLSMHWHQSRECDFPKLTTEQLEIVTGVLMGDGTISTPGKNPLFTAEMVSEKYLRYLNTKLGRYGKGVKLKHTAKESAKLNRESGFRPDAKEKNYSDTYRLQTRTSPEFNQFDRWYDSGEKVFPKNIELTPTVLKHWYVCDGTYPDGGGKNRIEISAKNEMNRFNNIVNLFNNIGFNARTSGKTVYFSNSESQKIFNYMREPLPGFEYKWP